MPHQPREGRASAVAGLAGAVLAALLAVAQAQSVPAGKDDAASMPRDYWRLPLAAQGDAPARWTDVERSLAPESCAACHPDKYREWRTSVHAAAFSPGLVGQLLTYDAGQARECMKCHAPLAEQRRAFEAARARSRGDVPAAQGLAAAGNSCAGCHVRAHRRYGPPQRESGTTGQGDTDAPHGGVYRTTYFERSAFCSACHQFPQAYAINGKPLQNTYAEWRASPQAAQGVTCQACHMPGRRHLWRGIHDPETVAAGLTARFEAGAEGARFSLTNSGIGHAFPTYITPKVVMRAVALDAAGRPRPASAASRVIQRVVRFSAGRWVETSDTRLFPGDTVTLEVPWRGGERVRMWLEVSPDDYYDHQVYDGLLGGLRPGSAAARLIAAADRRAGASHYRLFETVLRRPD